MKLAISYVQKFITPKSENEDIRRREFILNVLLVFLISFLSVATVMDLINSLVSPVADYQNNSLSTIVIAGVLALFIFLYTLSRQGYVRCAAYGMVLSFFVLAAYLGLHWGVDLPSEIVFYAVVIVIAGILVDTRFAFFMTGLIAFTMGLETFLVGTGLIQQNTYWRAQAWSGEDVVMFFLVYLGIATVSWLSNREIERSLIRARKSEHELKTERDMLEVRVDERTEELRKAQLEQMTQTYRFVEFGRLAGGLFHDLLNPLTALSLNIESIASRQEDSQVADLADEVTRAQSATAHMQKLIDSMRKHIAHEGMREVFAADRVIEDVMHILAFHARQHGVELVSDADTIELYGDPVAFTQILTNFISNAVESFPSDREPGQVVSVAAHRLNEGLQVVISDNGVGIASELQEKIFEPFFSTKVTSQTSGLGIGLSLAKRLIEKEFNGTLSLHSEIGKGTTFTIHLPIREP